MTILELFFVFLKIGLFTFGGGYGMIPLVQQEMASRGWLDAETLVRYIGICESTPGPIAVNMATFVGSSRAGLVGSACATLGVVLPSFVIILAIASACKNFRRRPAVRAAMSGVRPAVAGMIAATGLAVGIRCRFPAGGGADVRQGLIALILGAALLV